METPRRKFWKTWKWTGLGFFVFALLFRRWLPSYFVAAASIYGLVVIVNLAFFVFRYLKERLLWRVRHRVIGAFIFVGVIPLVIILLLGFLVSYMLLMQLGAHYLSTALQENVHMISGINLELAGHIASADAANELKAKASPIFKGYSAKFPRLAARLSRRTPNGALTVVSKYDPHGIVREISPYPGDAWRGGDASFEGIIKDGDKLLMISLRPVPGLAGFYLETTAPLDKSIEDRLRLEKSLYATFIANEDASITASPEGFKVKINNTDSARESTEKRINQDVKSQDDYIKSDPRSKIWGVLPLRCKLIDSGKSDLAAMATFRVPRSTVIGSFLGLGNELSQAIFKAIYVLAGMFAFAELISLIIGITISRHITRSVHDMYKGILALQKGDLQHRIPVRRNDQLGLLAHSFNQMSGSIGRLLEEVVEKKRLEKELEIAREVQATLFPKQLPHPPGMSIFGGCKPARVVSGDYYDFIVEDETHLNIIVGDISGKGISAALLMANLQAAMRSQLLATKHADPETIGEYLADVMAQLNRQIYLSSPPEKYATLFLSRYDAEARRLWYCNAGHLPPILLDAQRVQALEATGMVIGLFPDAAYESKSVELKPGTVLAIFTDGVTEALNKAEEEFGEGQLLESLKQSHMRTPEYIWQHVMSKVGDWQSDLPQYDDITLIVAKAG